MRAQTTLVATGSVWKYLADGSDQGTAWRLPGFDDTNWAMGPGELGFGDEDEATLIGNATNQFITFYFRHSFEVADPSGITRLLVALKRDDGAIVYLNGTPIFRSQMPAGEVDYLTLAPFAVVDDGNNLYTNAVDPALVVSGPNLLAVEIHQSARTSSDVSFDLALVGNAFLPNPLPPTVSVTSPASGAAVTRQRLIINASALDSDSTIVLVEFLADGNKIGADRVPPYSVAWTNPAPAHYTLAAVAYDGQGLSTTSAPVDLTVLPAPPSLIPFGAQWTYLDDNSDPGPAWVDLAFDDSDWSSGLAQLGYGDGDETTTVRGGPSTNRFVTTYFRHLFEVDDPSAYTNLVVRLQRDDGAVVYLNGAEVFRSNMPGGAITPATYASEIVDSVLEGRIFATHADVRLLTPGMNVMAVEVHQVNSTSSDVSFDLELRHNVPPTAPEVSILNPTSRATYTAPARLTIEADATDLDDPVERLEFYLGANPVGSDTTYPYTAVVSDLEVGTYAITAVGVDHSGLRATSAPVQIAVLGPPTATTLIATGSIWKYLDTGTNAGTAWKEGTFDDSAWRSGPAELGYGDATETPPRPEATVVRFGPSANSKYITTYFRHPFVAANVATFTNLAFRVVRDDGAVVYLNGAEIFRMNMPATNPITFMTRAPVAVGGSAETTYYPTNIDPGLLLEGPNLLAVEIHQDSPSSSDISFDLELQGIAPPEDTRFKLGIRPSSNQPGKIEVFWASDSAILEQADRLDGQWEPVPGRPVSPYVISPTEPMMFYRLRQ